MLHTIAYLIGTHAVVIFGILLTLTLVIIACLWQLLERYYPTLWRWASRLWHYAAHTPPIRRLRERYPRTWTFLGRRLSPDEYLGLHLTLGVLLIAVAFAIFSNIAGEIVQNEELTRFDQILAEALHQNATPTGTRIFTLITRLGDGTTLAVGGMVVGAILLARRRWHLLAGWVAALAGGGALNAALKALFQRARPDLANPFYDAMGWSFPSGHAMGSLIAYGMVTYVLVLNLRRPWAEIAVTVMVALVLLIGFSRMYLGVHYFSDVVAGYAAGITWLATCISGIEVARRYRRVRHSRHAPPAGAAVSHHS